MVVIDDTARRRDARLTGSVCEAYASSCCRAACSWESLPQRARAWRPSAGIYNCRWTAVIFTSVEGELSRLPCPIVIDHNGKFLEPVGLEHPGVAALFRLIDGGRAWVKTSGVYETSRPARRTMKMSRCWRARSSSDTRTVAYGRPTGRTPRSPAIRPTIPRLVDLFAAWCGSPGIMRQVLVDNPAVLYGFDRPGDGKLAR